jgi:hypothetical protein
MYMSETAYIPGMCNINQAEIAYRKKARNFGIIASVIVLVACLLLGASWWITAILLFVPVYIASIGFLQVRNRFCVSYGAKGQQNADDGNDAAYTVKNSDDRAKDKIKARTMNLQALAMTLGALALVSLIMIYFVS